MWSLRPIQAPTTPLEAQSPAMPTKPGDRVLMHPGVHGGLTLHGRRLLGALERCVMRARIKRLRSDLAGGSVLDQRDPRRGMPGERITLVVSEVPECRTSSLGSQRDGLNDASLAGAFPAFGWGASAARDLRHPAAIRDRSRVRPQDPESRRTSSQSAPLVAWTRQASPRARPLRPDGESRLEDTDPTLTGGLPAP